ncbi:Flavin-dependent monooxygenase, oxygenase subunit HsaA [Pigmentiphaga humi]|uniref:Flavin-dependent monooxygenase, oxygenase subunit HsaA n=1 Tax=Pigmentiphaga humi TaxID=2478468 RepID=A0A3P4AX58_9BURK|nr:acyl-CoA dehydrogenase family protein [Pigmentiphaga humi]VCU67976.1 Flavin-dependent monooxygenase, oxygenase subunit HsaA [Pigmentiphaga humi]
MSSFAEHAVLEPPRAPDGHHSLHDALEALAPMLKASARAVETARRVPASHVDAIRATGFFDLVKPAAYGGAERDFATLVEANLILARNCASTAWVCGLLAAHQWLVASFPAQAQQDVWGSNADALLCGSYAPAARAQAVPGGYRLSGKWSFASGCDNAHWAVCAAMIPALADPGRLEPAFLLVPAADYRVDDTWDVVGLAGTGSKTLVLDEVFVPGHRILTFAQTTSGATPGAEHHRHEPGYRIPMLAVIPSCLASVAVGAAQGALADYIAATSVRVTRGAVAGGQQKMAEFPTVQLRVAEAAAAVDAAQEILLRDLRRVAAAVARGQVLTEEARILSRRGQAYAVALALRAVEALNAATGGMGLDLNHPVQRAWRDVNAIARHISMNWDAVGTMSGQMLLGLTPRGQY